MSVKEKDNDRFVLTTLSTLASSDDAESSRSKAGLNKHGLICFGNGNLVKPASRNQAVSRMLTTYNAIFFALDIFFLHNASDYQMRFGELVSYGREAY